MFLTVARNLKLGFRNYNWSDDGRVVVADRKRGMSDSVWWTCKLGPWRIVVGIVVGVRRGNE
jgi:hypothetical protein